MLDCPKFDLTFVAADGNVDEPTNPWNISRFLNLSGRKCD